MLKQTLLLPFLLALATLSSAKAATNDTTTLTKVYVSLNADSPAYGAWRGQEFDAAGYLVTTPPDTAANLNAQQLVVDPDGKLQGLSNKTVTVTGHHETREYEGELGDVFVVEGVL